MKRAISLWLCLMLLLLAACGINTAADRERQFHTVCDMAGRQVEAPVSIASVYSTGQPGVVMLYSLCPEKLLGWCFTPTDDEAACCQDVLQTAAAVAASIPLAERVNL